MKLAAERSALEVNVYLRSIFVRRYYRGAMTSHSEIDSVVEHDSSVIKSEIESQNKDDNTLMSEYKQIFDSCRTVYHDPVLLKVDNNYGFHHDENTGGKILYRRLSKDEQEDVSDTKNVDISSNDANKKVMNHISEEVIIKTEDNIKLMDHQEEENYYNSTTVKVKMQLDDAAKQKDNEYHLETHSKVTDPHEQEIPGDCYYRLPESYYSSMPLVTDQSSVDMEGNKAEMQQDAQNALEARDTNSLLKVKKLSKSGKARRYNSLTKKKLKQYRCLICFASYRKFSAYLTHKNTHFKKGTHQILRKRREGKHLKMIRGIAHFQCDKCNKSYTCESSLNVHIKMSHGHVPIKIIKTEPEDVLKSDNLNSIRREVNTELQEEIYPASHYSDSQSDSGPSLLKMNVNLESVKYSILLLQQDSINAAEDILNEVKMTYNCPECLKFFDKTAYYRSHLNTHLKKKFMVLRSQKMGLLKTLKDMRKFPYLSYNNGYIANIHANKHLQPIAINTKSDDGINEISSSVKQCSNTITAELLQAANSISGDNPNNFNGIKGTFTKDNFQQECSEEYGSRSLGENSPIFVSPGENECVKSKSYTCSKCSKHCVGSSTFREHLNQHLREEMILLYKKKKEMYIRHMSRSKIFKCEKCNKEYLYDGFLKKHRKFCQGPPRDELKDIFLGCNINSLHNLNRKEVKIYSGENNSESNTKSSCDPTENRNTTIIANAESERTLSNNDESGFVSRSDSTSIQGSFEIDFSNVEQKTTADTIMALINETQHVCPKCPRTFETLSLYWQHLNKHYSRECHLLTYKKSHVSRNNHVDKLHKCDQCDKSYTYKNRLELHINSQHGIPLLLNDNVDAEYKCTCGKFYTRKSRMATCFKTHTVAKELPRCRNCKYHFQNEEELNIHRNFVHTEHRYLCKFCPVEYYTVEDLFTHLKIHKKIQLMEYKVIAENIEEKQYLKCFICKEISSDLNEFKLHFLNDHRKPYLCTICVKSFNDLDQFMSHTNTYHLSSRERWLLELLQAFFALMQSWICKPCNFRSENPDALAEHLYDHRTLNVVGLDLLPKSENCTPKRKCVDCRRIYSSNKQLEEHRGLYHNPNQDLKKKISPTSTENSDNSMAKCLKCNIQFIAEGYLKAHFCTVRHVEVQSFLLNEQFVSASMSDDMSEVESMANIVVTVD